MVIQRAGRFRSFEDHESAGIPNPPGRFPNINLVFTRPEIVCRSIDFPRPGVDALIPGFHDYQERDLVAVASINGIISRYALCATAECLIYPGGYGFISRQVCCSREDDFVSKTVTGGRIDHDPGPDDSGISSIMKKP